MPSVNVNSDNIIEKLSSKQPKIVNAIVPTQQIQSMSTYPRQVYAQSSVIYSQPQFFSPLQTNTQWQIPKRREMAYEWALHYGKYEPVLAAALNFYCQFPLTSFKLNCEDSKILNYFEHFNKKVKMLRNLQMGSKHYYLLGDMVPFCGLVCPKCRSTGFIKKGVPCDHMIDEDGPGGTFDKMAIMNPFQIDIQQNPFGGDPLITYRPDEVMKKLVFTKQPRIQYDRLDPTLIALVAANRPVPLLSECVSHLAHDPDPGAIYGNSIATRLFKTLAYKDKLMTSQWVVAERLILPVRIIKVGDAQRPAGPLDIAQVQEQIAQVTSDPNLTLVTHHAFDYSWQGAEGKILQLTQEYEMINKELLQGLMINEALLAGNAGGYQVAAIGAETMIARLESWRTELSSYVEDNIYSRIALWQGFIDKEKSYDMGEAVPIYPRIQWPDLNIRDDTQQKAAVLNLYNAGTISRKSLLEKHGFNYDHEIEQMRYENMMPMVGGNQAQGGAGGAPMGGGIGGGMGGPEGMPVGGGGPEMGGETPMGEAGAPPAAGMGTGAPPMGPTAASSLGGTMGKITSKKNKGKMPDEESVQPTQGVQLTSLEQKMYKSLEKLKSAKQIPFDIRAQVQVGKYKADFAIPRLRLAIECDGTQWHSSPEAKAHDNQKDSDLMKVGWTTVRYSEPEIKEKMPMIEQHLMGLVYKLWQKEVDRHKATNKEAEALVENIKLASIDENIRIGRVIDPIEEIIETEIKETGE